MINPLSIQFGQTITGKEINDWCNKQIKNNGSHIKDVIRLQKKNYKDNRLYCKSYKVETGGCDTPCIIEFIRCDK